MHAVVLGASRGLGLCLVRRLLEKKWQVSAGSRSATFELNALQEAFPESLHLFCADITDDDAMETGAGSCRDRFGPVDALCVSAGVLLDEDRTMLLHEQPPEVLRRTFDVNVVGPSIAVRRFLPVMARGGRLFIVTSEGVGLSSCGSWVPAYGLSKTAATKMCGIYNASVSHIDFFAVHPGRMNTDMGRTTAQIEPETAAEGIERLMSGETPCARSSWYVDYNGAPLLPSL